jgi:hypothetical protein
MDWTSNLFKMRVCTVYIALNILYCKHVNIWDDIERILEYLNENKCIWSVSLCLFSVNKNDCTYYGLTYCNFIVVFFF